ncbi:hypothetical protein RHSIM_Rhsim01G0092900 [Rhododendron simsii]|uniref:Serine incorporator n=1 Tax=Rhododendron simsii TaxID=118357 RepID=A0A834HFN1_RHOSS|nr:hypothetical protein RHSIM_Rhsim01G0092900 [Rhododendron simsii]
MEDGTANSTIDRYAKVKKGSWFNQFWYGSNPWMARYVYGLMFLVATLLAWAVRDYGHAALKEMESRELWHSGWWSAKILMMIGLTVVPFFVPSTVIRLYGDVAHFGAGVFLVIQLISIISFIKWLDDCCQSDKHEDKCEPPDSKCIKKVEAATKSDWLSIISFVIAVLAIVIATFSTGIDSQCFPFTKDVKESDQDDVPYGFGFFHFVFATGAMYFAMLLISWNSHHTTKKWTIDVGWTSTWVRILNELLAACLYAWMLVAPSVWKSRQTAGSV